MQPKITKDYNKIRETYLNYLASYKQLNKGSLKGATPYSVFYIYKTYVIRYMEPARLTASSYK